MTTKQPLKVTSLKSNKLLPIHTSNVLLKFGIDIQGQTKFRVRKPTNLIWPPDRHFESDIAENLQSFAHTHKRHAPEIKN